MEREPLNTKVAAATFGASSSLVRSIAWTRTETTGSPLPFPGSDYYDLHRRWFFSFFAQIKDDLNLMTIAELQEKARALRMTHPELFEPPDHGVLRRTSVRQEARAVSH